MPYKSNLVPIRALIGILEWASHPYSSGPGTHGLLLEGFVPSHSRWSHERDFWEMGIVSIERAGRTASHHFRLELDKPPPDRRRSANEEPITHALLDVEGFALLLMYAAAGGRVRMGSGSTGRNHYLELNFPGEPPVDFHRLIVDAPLDRAAHLGREHHDLRKASLGRLITIDEEQTRIGKERVATRPMQTRKSATQSAVRTLFKNGMINVLPERRFRDSVEAIYESVNDLAS